MLGKLEKLTLSYSHLLKSRLRNKINTQLPNSSGSFMVCE
ncbi:hypothetical protein [Vibrio cholerae]|nr:hypothetical protein [Vibrio cholerae]CPR27030.1 hypothetical protein [Vibrio cholerae]CPR27033.1 hypothetical protein [Vibrio cholerae]